MTPSRPDPKQDDLALSSVAPSLLFPGRVTLYVHEVARTLSITERQVIDLLEEHRDTGGDSGLAGINIGNGNTKSKRNSWRIPVSALAAFIQARKTTAPL